MVKVKRIASSTESISHFGREFLGLFHVARKAVDEEAFAGGKSCHHGFLQKIHYDGLKTSILGETFVDVHETSVQ